MIWPSFLEGNARDAFDGHREDGEARLGGFSTWPEAVQWFLRTYAKDEYLEDAMAAMDRMSQNDGEMKTLLRIASLPKHGSLQGFTPNRSLSPDS